MNKHTEQKLEKYGVVIMALALFAIVLAKPMVAHSECGHGDWGKARHGEFFEKRTKALHDELKLSATQEPAWNTFVERTRPAEHRPEFDRSELSKLTTPERLDRMLALSKTRQQRLESHAQAVKLFYAQLTPEQQKVFDASFHPFSGHHAKP